MNVLTLEDLLEVTMFKCKICLRRLQAPVIQVGTYGNICGTCNERSIFTETAFNVDVETLLSKLYVPCNYKMRGCTYDGSYYNTCEHEKRCTFRDKVCPFAYVGECENELMDFHDITAHISNRHKHNVLIVKENNLVVVQNPTINNKDKFYLLSLDNKNFLLRTWVDVSNKYFLYAFYYFRDDINLKNIRFSFNMSCENTLFTVTGVNISVQHESVIGPAYDTNNAFRISLNTLAYLNSLRSVKILVSVDEDPVKPLTPVDNTNNKSVWARCQCSRLVDSLYFCKNCNTRKCVTCYQVKPSCACANNMGEYMDHHLMPPRRRIMLGRSISNNLQLINFGELMLIYEVACENTGCNQILKPNEYDQHKEVCLFKQHACPFDSQEKCQWRGLLKNMAIHVNDEHAYLINQDVFQMSISKIICFTKGDSVFKQLYSLDANGNLTITTNKLSAPIWDDSYRWEVAIREDKNMIMVITDVCTKQGSTNTINVKSYIESGVLTIYPCIKKI